MSTILALGAQPSGRHQLAYALGMAHATDRFNVAFARIGTVERIRIRQALGDVAPDTQEGVDRFEHAQRVEAKKLGIRGVFPAAGGLTGFIYGYALQTSGGVFGSAVLEDAGWVTAMLSLAMPALRDGSTGIRRERLVEASRAAEHLVGTRRGLELQFDDVSRPHPRPRSLVDLEREVRNDRATAELLVHGRGPVPVEALRSVVDGHLASSEIAAYVETSMQRSAAWKRMALETAHLTGLSAHDIERSDVDLVDISDNALLAGAQGTQLFATTLVAVGGLAVTLANALQVVPTPLSATVGAVSMAVHNTVMALGARNQREQAKDAFMACVEAEMRHDVAGTQLLDAMKKSSPVLAELPRAAHPSMLAAAAGLSARSLSLG